MELILSLTWTRELAQAIGKLSDAQLSVLGAELRRGKVVNATTLREIGLSTGEAVWTARKVKSAVAGNGPINPSDVAIAVEAILAGRSVSPAPPQIQVVCTTPFVATVPVRATFATSLEMIRTATREILVVGYLFTEGAKEILQELAAAGRTRKIIVTLVGNRLAEHRGLLRSIWKRGGSRPRLLSREIDPNDALSALHAKLLVGDRRDALITSANLSTHGLHRNIEIGIRVRSAEMSGLVDFVESMASTGELKSIEWDE